MPTSLTTKSPSFAQTTIQFPNHVQQLKLNKFWWATGQSNLADRIEEETLEAFVVARHLYAKFDCPVAHQNFSLLATAHDCETG